MNDQNTSDSSSRRGGGRGNRTIRRDEVGEFFEDFTEQYGGRRVTVEERGNDGQQRVVASRQPLETLSYQADDGRFDIRIVLGANSGESFAHVISEVESIDLDLDASGAADVLRIRSRSGTTSVRLS